jgi:hypothetical protein
MYRKPTCTKTNVTEVFEFRSVLKICRYFSEYGIHLERQKKLAYYICISRYVQKYGCKTLPVTQNGPNVGVVK